MSSFVLKMIAIISMTIDHIGFSLFPKAVFLRIIGRIAMPIFAFQIALGFRKTSSQSKYIFRVLLCAILSQIPFMLLKSARYMIKGEGISKLLEIITKPSEILLNICFPFTIALCILYCLNRIKKQKLFIVPLIFLVLLPFTVPMDYDWLSIILVISFYYCNEHNILYSFLLFAISIFYCLLVDTSIIQIYMVFATPLLFFYNGKKGKGIKYFFYAYYPLHMLLLFLIRLIMIT